MASTTRFTATIANGATISDAIPAEGSTAFGLQMPSAFTGVSISFLVSADGGTTYQALYDITSTLVSVTVAASRSYDLPGELTAWDSWKIVSGSAEGAKRLIPVVGKRE